MTSATEFRKVKYVLTGVLAGILIAPLAIVARERFGIYRYDSMLQDGGEVSYLHRGPAFLREQLLVKPEGHDINGLWSVEGWQHDGGVPWFSLNYMDDVGTDAPERVRFQMQSGKNKHAGLFFNWDLEGSKVNSGLTFSITDKYTNKFKMSYVDIDLDGVWDARIEGVGEKFFVWFEDTWRAADFKNEGERIAVLNSPDARALRFEGGQWKFIQ